MYHMNRTPNQQKHKYYMIWFTYIVETDKTNLIYIIYMFYI